MFDFIKRLSKKSPQHSDEYQQIFESINMKSEEELDSIHDALIPFVNDIPFSVPLPGTNQTIAEAQKNHEQFCKKVLPNGTVFGCRTYGEAEEMNRAVVHRLDLINKNS